MGSTFRVPIVVEPDADVIARALAGHGLRIVAAMPRAAAPLYSADFRRPTAFLLGNEGGGLDARWLALADEEVAIPMRPPVESLNVAVACALLVYEAYRQRAGERS